MQIFGSVTAFWLLWNYFSQAEQHSDILTVQPTKNSESEPRNNYKCRLSDTSGENKTTEENFKNCSQHQALRKN